MTARATCVLAAVEPATRLAKSEPRYFTRMLAITLASITLLQRGQAAGEPAAKQPVSAASDGGGEFCEPQSPSFYRHQQTIPWEPVAPERIEEEDYHGRTFEARLDIGREALYAYKVLMNIRGQPIAVSVALLDYREQSIDVKRLASAARMLLQNEAMKAIRKKGLRESGANGAFLALASNKYDIVLWSSPSTGYFAVDTPERFAVFEIAGNEVRYVCTYQP